jgi:hypothetical protein
VKDRNHFCGDDDGKRRIGGGGGGRPLVAASSLHIAGFLVVAAMARMAMTIFAVCSPLINGKRMSEMAKHDLSRKEKQGSAVVQNSSNSSISHLQNLQNVQFRRILQFCVFIMKGV